MTQMPFLLRQVEDCTRQLSRLTPTMWCWEVLQTQAPVQLMVRLIVAGVFLSTITVRVAVLEAGAIVVKMKRTSPEEEEVLVTATVTISINR